MSVLGLGHSDLSDCTIMGYHLGSENLLFFVIGIIIFLKIGKVHVMYIFEATILFHCDHYQNILQCLSPL